MAKHSHGAFWRGSLLLAAALWLTFAPTALSAFPLRMEVPQAVESEVDPVLHKYLYANANPVNRFDPSGNMSVLEIAGVAGIVGITAKLALPTVASLLGFSGSKLEARIDGVLRFIIGVSTAIGATALGPVGVPLMAWGLDEASAGLLQAMTGSRINTLGGRAIAYGFNIDSNTAEMGYGLAAGGPAIAKTLADIGTLILARGPQILSALRSAVTQAESPWIMGAYDDLATLTAGQKHAIEAHHLLEQRIMKMWGYTDAEIAKAPAVILSQAEHQVITAALLKELPKGGVYSQSQVAAAYQKVYAEAPEWLNAIKGHLKP